ncbi:MAG: PAS domain-containing sensor histidine kinase [Spirochaetaceae bacterium]|jgi:signal transduction histidine kinase|nr:PAS domain-containing sensor histidine kinase [Spirochaetaceae bacterium]
MNKFYRQAIKRDRKLSAESLSAILQNAVQDIERLESAFDSLNQGLLVCNKTHHLILENMFARRFFPFILKQANEGPIWDAIDNEEMSIFLRQTLVDEDRIEGREFETEVHGKTKIYALSVYPLVANSLVAGSLITIEDTTERRGREARLRRAENLASLTTLAAGVAHEIKNPLAAMSIHSQLAEKALSKIEEGDNTKTTVLRKYLGVVNEEIERLNSIVVDFLFAVRPMDITLIRNDMNVLLERLAEFIRPEAEKAGIVLIKEFDKTLPLLDYDERYMKQVLINLCKNAIAAMKEGGLLIINSVYSDTEAFISIVDTGIGIAEDAMAKIFDPYFTTKSEGTGLGLTLVYKIIKEHRGDISVRSKPGEGAAFTISLPLPQTDTLLIKEGP